MKIRLSLSLLAVLSFSVLSVFAQDAKSTEERAKLQTSRMTEQLDLSEDQQKSVQKINLDFGQQMYAIKLEVSEAREAKRDNMRIIREERKKALEEVLTVEQMEKLESAREQQRKRTSPHGDKPHGKPNMEARKQMHRDIKAYAKENVYPVLTEQRRKLDKQLKSKERATIQKVQIQLSDLKMEIYTLRKSYKENEDKGVDNHLDRLSMRRTLMLKKWAIIKPVEEIAEKRKDEIAVLMEEIAAQKEKWHNDIRNIKQKYDGDKRPMQPRSRMNFGKRRELAGTAFLLMEFDNNIQSLDVEEREVVIYPNPATKNSNIRFEVTKAGPVKIELLNRDGQLIKVVLDKNKQLGMHHVSVDLQSLSDSFYFYRITDNAGSETHRFLIQDNR